MCEAENIAQNFQKIKILSAGCKIYTKSDGTCACSFLIDQRMNWTSAVETCESVGARLPEILSAEDNADIFELMVSLKSIENSNLVWKQYAW